MNKSKSTALFIVIDPKSHYLNQHGCMRGMGNWGEGSKYYVLWKGKLGPVIRDYAEQSIENGKFPTMSQLMATSLSTRQAKHVKDTLRAMFEKPWNYFRVRTKEEVNALTNAKIKGHRRFCYTQAEVRELVANRRHLRTETERTERTSKEELIALESWA